MSEHRATIEWHRGDAAFAYETYPRAHTLAFAPGIAVPGTAAAQNIPRSAAGTPGVDPEQAYVASLAACHMLWFLHLACRAGFRVRGYVDVASGELGRDGDGRMAMTRVTLRPRVRFDDRAPSAEEHLRLHHAAHDQCFIANSVRSHIDIDPSLD